MKKLLAIILAALLMTGAAAAIAEDYTFGTDTAFRPFEYTDETGTLVGIDVELLAAIAEDQGFTYTIEPLGWDASIAACQAGQKDAMIAGASITEKRKNEGWIFSDGYYNATQCMAVARDSDIAGFEGLQGQSVAVKTGTESKTYADSLAETYGFTVMTFESSPDIYQAVNGGLYQVQRCSAAAGSRNRERRRGLRHGNLQSREAGNRRQVQCRPCQYQGKRKVRRDSCQVPG